MVEGRGALALLGSGEYTAAMEETDSWLIRSLGGPGQARVALMPTASALEPGQPERWNSMGAAHFARLGARATPLPLLGRDDAGAGATAAALREANFFYFSGGNPEYLTATLEDTPAWEVVRARHEQGAVVAGCSAGAMMLGSYVLRVRAVREGQPPAWRQGLGLAAGLAILPHFDRVGLMLDAARLHQLVMAAPCGVTLVGIDEDTALVRLPRDDEGPGLWRVMGRRTVSIFDEDGEVTRYRSGELLALG